MINPSLADINAAAMRWYGVINPDTCCLAENRLMKGERT